MTQLTCKICGTKTNSLKTMGDHYRKKHPAKMKRPRGKEKPKDSRKNCDNCRNFKER